MIRLVPRIRCSGWRELVRLAVLAAATLAVFATGSARAQDGPAGIGFAQAEEGTWACRAGDPVTALNCARDKCRAEGGGQDCYRTTWCFPAGWSGVVTVWLPEFRATRPLCGAPSLAALLDAMKAHCDGTPGATGCDAYLLTDPLGQVVDLAPHFVPAPAACVAARAESVVGLAASPANVEAARLASGAAIVRTIALGQPITMDLRADRLNLDLDSAGNVRAVRCG